MFSNPEDDEFFNPTSTSNLASLFGTSMTSKQDTNTSLVYTAPKQPKMSGQETPKIVPKPVSQSSVMCSKFVDVFKLSDKNNTPHGKCGLAIIGNPTVKAYDIIIYKSKQEIITRSKLNSDFTFIVQSNNFSYFCDEKKQEWSVHFENNNELDDFVEKIKSHNGKVVHNKTIDPCDTSLTNKSRAEHNVVKNTTSGGKDKDSDSTSDNSTNQTKANILTRMAKMGQSILPGNIPSKSSDRSDSETDEQTPNRKPVKKRQKFVLVNGEYVPLDKVKTVSNQALSMQTVSVPEYVMVNGQLIPASTITQNLSTPLVNPMHSQYVQNIPTQMMLAQPQASPLSDSLHVFIAENRTHNCEMRMNMSQLSAKLDTVLSNINKGGQVGPTATADMNELELKILERVKELEESKKIINSLQEQHTKFQEAAIDDKETIAKLRQQSLELNQAVLEHEHTIQLLEKQTNTLEQQIGDNKIVQENLEEAQQIISNLRETVADQQNSLDKFKKIEQDSCKNQNSEVTINELNEKVEILKSELEDKNAKANLFAKKLKQSMNYLYQQVMENFEDENVAFQSLQIKQILSQKLKNATFTIIQEFQNDFDSGTKEITVPTESSQPPPSVPPF